MLRHIVQRVSRRLPIDAGDARWFCEGLSPGHARRLTAGRRPRDRVFWPCDRPIVRRDPVVYRLRPRLLNRSVHSRLRARDSRRLVPCHRPRKGYRSDTRRPDGACHFPRIHPSWGHVGGKLDRLGRSTRDVLNLVHELESKDAHLRVLEPEVSTKGPVGKMVLTVLGMVAEMEVGFIRERQRAGSRPQRPRAFTRAGQ
jgi:Resolvase, N terminal domain